MPGLTDTAIRKLKPRAKAFKMYDSQGLFLLVHPNGSRYWRMRYKFAGKENTIALGVYPDISLAMARRRCGEEKQRIAEKIDPVAHKKIQKITEELAQATTFSLVAAELYRKKEMEKRSPNTLSKVKRLHHLANVGIGNRPISQIQPIEILAILRKHEAAGHRETAKRVRAAIGEVIRFAVQTGRATTDPTWALRGAIAAPQPTPRPAIVEPAEFGKLLKAIDGYSSFIIKCALQLMTLLFPRPGELRLARWEEFNFDKAIWQIPADRMKMRRQHRVPLPHQAIAILRELHKATGDEELLFPGIRGKGRPISDNTLNAALRRMGYEKDEVVAHGFRATASTLLNESGQFAPDVIEAALAHIDQNSVRRAYNRALFWPQRVQMAQWWADYCDDMKAGKVQ